MPDRLVYAEIDLKAFANNLQKVKQLIEPSVKIMAVVKGNAYGHGIVRIAQEAEKLGANYLGVACIYEARKIREAQVKLPILILGYTDAGSLEELIKLTLTPTIIDLDLLTKLNKLGQWYKKIIPFHVKVDTGMHRFGLNPRDALHLINVASKMDFVRCEGVFTHFAEADAEVLDFSKQQLVLFNTFLADLKELSLIPPLIHAANSAATLRLPDSHFSMVRLGKILYGPIPLPRAKVPFTATQIISLKTQIVQIKTLQRGDSVGYGRSFKADRALRIALIPVGYADGFRRAPKTYRKVLVNGEYCSLVGRVSMDQSTIDVTHLSDVSVGDDVVILGRQDREEISVHDVAERLGTSSYEVVTALTERVGRTYL